MAASGLRRTCFDAPCKSDCLLDGKGRVRPQLVSAVT